MWSTQLRRAAWVASLTFALTTTAAAQEPGGPSDQAPIQARPGGPESTPRTTQELPVTKGTRLVVSNNAGEVTVQSWDRDAVKIEASHSERESVDVQTADQTMRIRTRAARGPAGLVDYRLTVPRWMPVNLSGTYLEATIEGTTAEVTVETVQGNVRVAGGSGAVSARSVMGTIVVDKASGRVQARSVNEGIRLSNVSGDVVAETTNGDIVIDTAQTTSLEASTVNGDITFNGTMRDSGAYRLTTHSGDVRIGLGGAANATVFVRTFQGDFSSDFPIQLPEGQSGRSGSKRFNFTLGNGSARIEVQSFNGDIHLGRKSVTSADEERQQRRNRRGIEAPPRPPSPPSPPASPKPPAPKPPPPPPLPDSGIQ
ncbi:MAG: DUF4097 family beta strand repeat protein [Acidobacteria bacterium]|nr:DUF4097 family beta strand repeat protein [Acidobacteriota bacterium]